jgi:nucleolar complex protein 3
MEFAEKLMRVGELGEKVVISPEKNMKLVEQLMEFTKDPKDVDVVLKAIVELTRVFSEIIPNYRIRDDQSKDNVDDEEGAAKGKQLSKEVRSLRLFEKSLLDQYRAFLLILEKLSKIKPSYLAQKAKTSEEEALSLGRIYQKMKEQSISSFCQLLSRHPHFNFRTNILQTLMPKLASQDSQIRKQVGHLLFELLANQDPGLLDFKVDILKELQATLKSRPHHLMEANLLDCLVLHLIIVDEQKAKAI